MGQLSILMKTNLQPERTKTMNINHKIRKDLIERSYPSPKHAAQILAYLHHNKKQVCSLSVISEQMRKSSPMTWPAAYDLAAMDKIGFADRRYHVFASHPDLKKLPLRQRIARNGQASQTQVHRSAVIKFVLDQYNQHFLIYNLSQ